MLLTIHLQATFFEHAGLNGSDYKSHEDYINSQVFPKGKKWDGFVMIDYDSPNIIRSF
jgi:hypothetical protein